MVKWARLFGNQYIGFWALGLILFALQELPYLVMPLFRLESNPIMQMQESSVLLDILEKICGTLCIVGMIFIVREDMPVFDIGSGIRRAGFVCMILALLLNWLGWWLYFHGHQSFGLMMGFLVALPPLYYLCIGLWRENRVLLMTGIVFLLVHTVHVYGNLKG